MKVNGTIAKEIAIHFLDRTTERYTPSMVAKTIIQAKSIMGSGYTKEEIVSVIDYIVDEGKVDMYSIGYVSSAINDVLEKVNKDKNRTIIAEQRKEVEKLINDTDDEVIDVESRERNQRKADRYGNESRKRKKPYSDLFEE